MYHSWLYLIEMSEGADRLTHDRARLLLWNALVLLQVKVEVVALTIF